MFETTIAPGELLVEIQFPARHGYGSDYQKMSRRKGDFAIASAAALLQADKDEICRFARLVLGAVGPVPIRCFEAENRLIGRPLNATGIAQAAELLPEPAFEFDSRYASRAYRKRIAPVLARRALTAAWRSVGEVAQ